MTNEKHDESTHSNGIVGGVNRSLNCSIHSGSLILASYIVAIGPPAHGEV